MSTVLVMMLALLVAACGAEAPGVPASPSATLRPYLTSTPTPTGTPLPETTQIPNIGPSPTPFTHTVREDDTLLGIALRYGVALDALIAANPDVDPRFLTVGQELLIPGPEGEVPGALAATPTPQPAAVSPVRCYPESSGGLWCLGSVRNDGDAAMEGVGALMTLYDAEGKPIATEATYAPLNLLMPGQQLPLGVHFPPPAPSPAWASMTVVSAVEARQVQERYPNVVLEAVEKQPLEGGAVWRVEGVARLEGEGEKDAQLRVLVIGLDAQGSIVAYREFTPPEFLRPGQEVLFTLEVMSLGPQIDGIELTAEAQWLP